MVLMVTFFRQIERCDCAEFVEVIVGQAFDPGLWKRANPTRRFEPSTPASGRVDEPPLGVSVFARPAPRRADLATL